MIGIYISVSHHLLNYLIVYFIKKAYIVPIPVAIETHFFKESDPVDFIARDVWTVEVKMVH